MLTKACNSPPSILVERTNTSGDTQEKTVTRVSSSNHSPLARAIRLAVEKSQVAELQEGRARKIGFDVNCHPLCDRKKQKCPHKRCRKDKNDHPFSNKADLSDTCPFNFKVFSEICVGKKKKVAL